MGLCSPSHPNLQGWEQSAAKSHHLSVGESSAGHAEGDRLQEMAAR